MFGLKSKENNENDMTLVVWAITVFGPRLWPLSAHSHLLDVPKVQDSFEFL